MWHVLEDYTHLATPLPPWHLKTKRKLTKNFSFKALFIYEVDEPMSKSSKDQSSGILP